MPPPPEWAAWRTKPSATFLDREKTFGETLEATRSDGRKVREKLFDALDASGWLHKAPSASEEVDAFLNDFYARRLTLRLLLGQHAACRAADRGEPADYIWATFDGTETPRGRCVSTRLRGSSASRPAASPRPSPRQFLRGETLPPRDCKISKANVRAGLDADADGVLEAEELKRARSLYADGAAPPPRNSICGLVDREMSPFDVSVRGPRAVTFHHDACSWCAAWSGRGPEHPAWSGRGPEHPVDILTTFEDRPSGTVPSQVQAIADIQEEVLRSPRNAAGVLPPFRLFGVGRAVTLPFFPAPKSSLSDATRRLGLATLAAAPPRPHRLGMSTSRPRRGRGPSRLGTL